MDNNITRREFVEKSVKLGASLYLGDLFLKTQTKSKDMDLLIKNGMVFDGIGNKPKQLDILIKNDKIFLMDKNIPERKAKRVIDARGKIVCPGFIDIHNHTDTNILINPKAESMVHQGVTTLLCGNCGDSPVPLSEKEFEEEKKRYKEKYDIDMTWKNFDQYLAVIEKKGTAINFATLIGQGALRGAVVGYNDKESSNDEMKKMKDLIDEAMKAGAFGLSTGLEYTPGSFAKTPELIELCKVVKKYNGIYATHMRNEDDRLIEAMEEAIKIAKDAKVSLQISHLKTCYPRSWHKIDQVIQTLEIAKKEGLKILADRYPYTAFSTGLSMCFPMWVREGSFKAFLEKLKNPDLQEKLKWEIQQEEIKFGSWDKVFISNVTKPQNKYVQGKNILELSKEKNKTPYEYIRDLLIDDDSYISMIVFAMSEDNLKTLYKNPLVIIGSDGSAIAPYGELGKGNPHPRNYGAFVRVLKKYSFEEKIFPPEKAIQKMTSMPAEKIGIVKRGSIKTGFFADINIIDPDKLDEGTTWTKPHEYPKGIDYVIINGQIVLEKGVNTGLLAGKVLRK